MTKPTSQAKTGLPRDRKNPDARALFNRGQLNDRQDKAIGRMFRAGVDGFKGGMSAEKYIGITDASRATATRDLQDLVAKGALTRTGERRHTRYHLNLPE